jgi:hypothetical protein
MMRDVLIDVELEGLPPPARLSLTALPQAEVEDNDGRCPATGGQLHCQMRECEEDQ